MDETAKVKIVNWLLFIYLAIFPFGQLARFEIIVASHKIPLLGVDLVLGLFVLVFLVGKFKRPKIWPTMLAFLLIGLFSMVVFFAKTGRAELVGFLYLLRLTANFIFLVIIFNVTRASRGIRELIFKSLIVVSTISAIFGWIQYFLYSDLRFLYWLGWDDHLYRLTGTFLDPGFTSILLVFGFLASLSTSFKERRKYYIYLAGFFLLTLLFTYSRAGYLALVAGSLKLLLPQNWRYFILVLMFLVLGTLFLPRIEGEGVRLERLASINKRLVNYGQTFEIFKRSPLFGVGYNNLCLAKKYFFPDTFFGEHSCSGSDSSVLFVLATTGVLGASIFLYLLWKLSKVQQNIYGRSFLACGSALLVHSLFVNSLFYPWVLGWLSILAAMSIRE
ncbi:O-antigen ligase family protein [Candidatus Woesebacteria bacterium]|nr:O-antigen ligase family protein [Candidatus Woesebacteria bacterium]